MTGTAVTNVARRTRGVCMILVGELTGTTTRALAAIGSMMVVVATLAARIPSIASEVVATLALKMN